MSDPDLQQAFCNALLRFEELAREFTRENLELERVVLHSGQAGSGRAANTFKVPESTMTRQEVWRVKFLLLDIVYGEPSSAMTRITSDLTSSRGYLYNVWNLVLHLKNTEFDGPRPSAGTIEAVHAAIAAYGLGQFKPNVTKCLALWTGVPEAERALLSGDVTNALNGVIARLRALEASFSDVEYNTWALVHRNGSAAR
ncbi:hypothetical protein ABZW32_19255 [Streptomyces sp. NPDC004667]|uniref:hypothetical protein n=1 Tax=Streptomyces sp. NPDC004667 TaxID=3154285 RepID=UPI0033A09C63